MNFSRTATAALAGIGVLTGVLGVDNALSVNQAALGPHQAITTGMAWHEAQTGLTMAQSRVLFDDELNPRRWCEEDEIAIWYEDHHQCIAFDDLQAETQAAWLEAEQAVYRDASNNGVAVRSPREGLR